MREAQGPPQVRFPPRAQAGYKDHNILAQPLSREEAARELLRRRRARESLVSYAQAIDIPGAPVSDDPDEWLFKPVETQMAAHHRLFLREAQECIEKPYGRLMIFASPGSAKTTYSSVVAPTWAMGKWPGFKVVSLSYSSVPTDRNSRRCQQICRSPEYQAIWEGKAAMRRGSLAVNEWSLENDSTMLASGILGSITSARADLGIIDDPVSGREDADSEVVRRKIRQAYEDDFLTRLKPGASIILIMTRWHEDDLAGSILPADYKGESGDILCRDGQVWRVVCLPAEAERLDDPLGRKPGQMLWPEWFSDRHWNIYRGNARTWSALYQQRPAPETGGQFEKGDFKRYRDTPKGLSWYMSGDYAVTEKSISDHPDFTQIGAFGVNHDADIYCEDGWGGQDAPDETADRTVAMVKRFKPIEMLIEAGVIFNAMNGLLMRKLRLARAPVVIEKMTSSQDKIAKAAAFRAWAKSGKVWVKEGSWGDALIAELCSFPYGRYDDRVDMCGQIGRRVDELYAPKEPEEEKRKKAVKPMSLAAAEARYEDEEDQERKRRAFMG